jgi:hypothetical protein
MARSDADFTTGSTGSTRVARTALRVKPRPMLANLCQRTARHAVCAELPGIGKVAGKWSGRWESNPRLKLGKLGYYHYTTPATRSILVRAPGFVHPFSRSSLLIDRYGANRYCPGNESGVTTPRNPFCQSAQIPD